MSLPNGNYTVTNRAQGPAGERLAITFNGVNNTATLTPLSSAASQVVSSLHSLPQPQLNSDLGAVEHHAVLR